MCACACACVRACVRAYVRACVRVCVTKFEAVAMASTIISQTCGLGG